MSYYCKNADFRLFDKPSLKVLQKQTAGGGLIVLGLGVWYIIATHSSRVAEGINNNAIIQHVLFDATADKLTLGVRFRR
jgi:hypothetical protein